MRLWETASDKTLSTPVSFPEGIIDGYKYGIIPGTGNGLAYYAVPEIYKDTGRRTYIMNEKGIIYYKDNANNLPPTSWPNPDPEKRGWIRFEEE